MPHKKKPAPAVPSEKPPQLLTRIPRYRPGSWIKIGDISNREPGSDLSGKVLRVKSLTCSITTAEQKLALWRVHFENGRALSVKLVERLASEAEIAWAQRQTRGI